MQKACAACAAGIEASAARPLPAASGGPIGGECAGASAHPECNARGNVTALSGNPLFASPSLAARCGSGPNENQETVFAFRITHFLKRLRGRAVHVARDAWHASRALPVLFCFTNQPFPDKNPGGQSFLVQVFRRR
ncbi:hypothetical protein Busp01_02220 [Trinickia caryophylli]|uniref:Uncharacterized protein n=1 Tax=Trinickia caryophylli TaxID=28094 RepID=A0A1X7CK28_TRICW|nr:hypothetical protein C0Z17_26740 [Trinickia caryophylli]GLU30380.1 hypothetical protein Busp01_02220 [Trinickia caryophylli]SME97965.1 hypothetical protein SAMN06295900_101505 [Trinickia caryophylli]